MDEDQREFAEDQLRDQERVYKFWEPVLDRTARIYEHAVTSLWVGNAGGTLAMLSFIAATWKDGAYDRLLLCPLVAFLLGVIAMAAGTVIALWTARAHIERMAHANSVLSFEWRDIKAPWEEVGLTISDWRTRMAVLSAVLFIGGCIAAAAVLV